jgi:hypothetical protein
LRHTLSCTRILSLATFISSFPLAVISSVFGPISIWHPSSCHLRALA